MKKNSGKHKKRAISKPLTKAQFILSRLARIYDNRCFVTGKKFTPKGFTLHHLWYIEGDVIRKNYKDRDKYYKDLEPLVRKNPDRFVLITNGIHTRIDHKIRGLSRLRRDTLIRLFLVCMLTRK